jgi:hypothetical protein
MRQLRLLGIAELRTLPLRLGDGEALLAVREIHRKGGEQMKVRSRIKAGEPVIIILDHH